MFGDSHWFVSLNLTTKNVCTFSAFPTIKQTPAVAVAMEGMVAVVEEMEALTSQEEKPANRADKRFHMRTTAPNSTCKWLEFVGELNYHVFVHGHLFKGTVGIVTMAHLMRKER